jgi:hypothetical protein
VFSPEMVTLLSAGAFLSERSRNRTGDWILAPKPDRRDLWASSQAGLAKIRRVTRSPTRFLAKHLGSIVGPDPSRVIGSCTLRPWRSPVNKLCLGPPS